MIESSPTPPLAPRLVLVTGGGGFLGQTIVRRLLARGDSVRTLQRGDYPALAALGADPPALRSSEHRRVEIARGTGHRLTARSPAAARRRAGDRRGCRR
mgnify:CR=1 FL=1